MQLKVHLQSIDGTLVAPEGYDIPYSAQDTPQGVAVGDINGDGLPDVAIADYCNGLVVLYHR